jgi:hypothetical protein
MVGSLVSVFDAAFFFIFEGSRARRERPRRIFLPLRTMNRYTDLAKGIAMFTQIGIMIAVPPVLLAVLGVKLCERFGIGYWLVAVMIVVGMISSAASVRSTLKGLHRDRARREKADGVGSGTNFNKHI